MALVFHWSGTIEVVRDKLKRCACKDLKCDKKCTKQLQTDRNIQ